MRALTTTEISVIHGGAATSEIDLSRPAYQLADLAIRIITPILNLIPFFGSSVSDWLRKPYSATEGQIMVTNGQYFIGGAIDKLFGSFFN